VLDGSDIDHSGAHLLGDGNKRLLEAFGLRRDWALLSSSNRGAEADHEVDGKAKADGCQNGKHKNSPAETPTLHWQLPITMVMLAWSPYGLSRKVSMGTLFFLDTFLSKGRKFWLHW
jgi:hypothetical protein